MDKQHLAKAVKAWKTVLSTRRVITDRDILVHEGTATFATTQKIVAILRPKTSTEVSSVMKIASRYKIPVYPVSGGRNWGLGSKVPQHDGVLLDLAGMNKITEYDDTLAYMRVEPGVTFGQAVEFLEKRNSRLMLDTVGSTPDASIIGNTAERGHGMALYSDRFNFVCGFEVVLPNGDLIRTGFDSIDNSKLGPLSKWGVGPYVDGLFTQSNLGVIVSLTIWLRPKSQHFKSFMFNLDSQSNLSTLLDRWREMGLEGLNASLRIFNDTRMISFAQRFPKDESRPLKESTKKTLRAKMDIGKWIGLGAVYPISSAHSKADEEFIKSRIGDLVDSVEFYDQAVVDALSANGDETRKGYLDFIFNKSLLRGNVSRAGFNMVYWRKPSSVPIGDIHKDGCGVIWYCPAIPFTGKDALKAISICERISTKWGFELNIGFLFISQRALDITGALCYDRDVKGEDKRAMECHNEIMKSLQREGYSPYRLGIQSMELIKHRDKKTSAFYSRLKEATDPHNVLAPGHYINLKKS